MQFIQALRLYGTNLLSTSTTPKHLHAFEVDFQQKQLYLSWKAIAKMLSNYKPTKKNYNLKDCQIHCRQETLQFKNKIF